MLRLPTIQIMLLVRFPNFPHTPHHNYQFFTILGSQSSSSPRLTIKTPHTLPLGLLLLLCHLPIQRRSIYLCNCLHLTEAFISDGAPKLLTEDINDVPNKKLHICLRMSFLCPCVVLKGDLVWAARPGLGMAAMGHFFSPFLWLTTIIIRMHNGGRGPGLAWRAAVISSSHSYFCHRVGWRW